MTKPQPLSPAAQAVRDAANLRHGCTPSAIAAGSLRAVAGQSETLYDLHEGKMSVIRTDRILAITAELEARQ